MSGSGGEVPRAAGSNAARWRLKTCRKDVNARGLQTMFFPRGSM